MLLSEKHATCRRYEDPVEYQAEHPENTHAPKGPIIYSQQGAADIDQDRTQHYGSDQADLLPNLCLAC